MQHMDFGLRSAPSIKMYVHLRGNHVHQCVRLVKERSMFAETMTCYDTYTLSILLPICIISALCLKCFDVVPLVFIITHTIYECWNRVENQLICRFPITFTVLYYASAIYLAVRMCMVAASAGIIQCVVSILLMIRYFMLQRQTNEPQEAHTP